MKTLFEFLVKDKINTVPEGFVDLGLQSKTLWATKNLGAKDEYDPGNYYAWGETKQKNEYDIDNYKFFDGDDDFTKYTIKDNKENLDKEDDVAYSYNNRWSIPTKEQANELIENTLQEEKTINGNKYIILTSNINNKQIIIPISGWYNINGLIKQNQHLRLWTSTCRINIDSNNAFAIKLNTNTQHDFDLKTTYSEKRAGLNVRPVINK